MSQKQKYIKLPSGEVIFFPPHIDHDTFKHLNPVTAGFCQIDQTAQKVHCYGNSYTLKLEANVMEDGRDATKQVFGIMALVDLLTESGNISDSSTEKIVIVGSEIHQQQLDEAFQAGCRYEGEFITGLYRRPEKSAGEVIVEVSAQRFIDWYTDKYFKHDNQTTNG